MPEISSGAWENFLVDYPDAHLMQTNLWGKFKSKYGWEMAHILVQIASRDGSKTNSIGAQILFRSLPLGLNLAYLPKGPVFDFNWLVDGTGWGGFWREVDKVCQKKNSVFLIVEPDLLEPTNIDEDFFRGYEISVPAGFQRGFFSVQPLRTIIVDLRESEEMILNRMKPKTRYNIRLAEKKGISIEVSNDITTFHQLMEITSQRDAFGVHSFEYFQRAYDFFHPGGYCELFVAKFQQEPVAALMVFTRGRRAWYFYGASSNIHRDRMPNYLLQWEAMRWARNKGCWIYDLWGVPDKDELFLEENFTDRSDGLWGVYRFKRGFGGQIVRAHGPWDRVYRKFFYTIYRQWIKVRTQGSGDSFHGKT